MNQGADNKRFNELNGIAFLSTRSWIIFVSMTHVSMILALGKESVFFNQVGRQSFLVTSSVLLTANVACFLGNRRRPLLEITWLTGVELLLFSIFIWESGEVHSFSQLGFALFIGNTAILMLVVCSSVRRGYEGAANRLNLRDNRDSSRSSAEADR